MERPPDREFSPAELELIRILREDRLDDPETRIALQAWTEEQEAAADRTNTSRANIELNLKRARLYLAAGRLEEAWENLEAVRRQAAQENEPDLLRAAEGIMDGIDQGSG